MSLCLEQCLPAQMRTGGSASSLHPDRFCSTGWPLSWPSYIVQMGVSVAVLHADWNHTAVRSQPKWAPGCGAAAAGQRRSDRQGAQRESWLCKRGAHLLSCSAFGPGCSIHNTISVVWALLQRVSVPVWCSPGVMSEPDF
eukprot:927052-Pelagomonas_calceolata.AAC.1